MAKLGYDAEALRDQVFERAAGRCEITGVPLGDNWALHHRRPRGAGGTRRLDTHVLSNVLALTHAVHNLATRSVHLDLAWSKPRGYLLGQWQIPRLEPVWLLERRWVLLLNSGNYLEIKMAPPANRGGHRTGDQRAARSPDRSSSGYGAGGVVVTPVEPVALTFETETTGGGA